MSNMNKSYSIMHNKKDTFDTFVKIAIIVLAAGSILAAVKCVFVGLQRDEEYAITLSYRLINGDRLLTQVWDPHQTSAFLLSAIEWIFIKATGGTVYLVLWCKIVGTIIHAFMAFYLYRTLLILTPPPKKYGIFIRFAILWHSPQRRNHSRVFTNDGMVHNAYHNNAYPDTFCFERCIRQKRDEQSK